MTDHTTRSAFIDLCISLMLNRGTNRFWIILEKILKWKTSEINKIKNFLRDGEHTKFCSQNMF